MITFCHTRVLILMLHYDLDNKVTVTQLNHILTSVTTPLIVYQTTATLTTLLPMHATCHSDTIHVIVTANQNSCFSWWLYRRVKSTGYVTSG